MDSESSVRAYTIFGLGYKAQIPHPRGDNLQTGLEESVHRRGAELTEKRVFAHSREIRRRPFDKRFEVIQGHERRPMAQGYGRSPGK